MKALRLFKRLAGYCAWRCRIAFRERTHPFKNDRTIWVEPTAVVFCTVKEFNPIKSDGVVLDGDWDLSDKLFENLDVFHAFKDHFINGIPWNRTDFYQNTMRAINNGRFYWGCKNVEDFNARCARLDGLYSEINLKGYKSQRKILRGFAGVLAIDEISVNVDRHGQLLFNNGAHRLSIAKLLQIEKVPVRITVWHKRCMRLSPGLRFWFTSKN